LAEKYERALTLFGEMNANPVRRDDPGARNEFLSAECDPRHTRDSGKHRNTRRASDPVRSDEIPARERVRSCHVLVTID